MAETEVITHSQWNEYAARVERANLKRWGKSLTRGSIASHANHMVIELQGDCMVVRVGWRQIMKDSIPCA